jgi:uncharacterized protein DUF4238
MTLHIDNHYVPRLYLKRFAAFRGQIWTYRILVAHKRVHVWKLNSISGVAYHAHLYTRLAAGVETDEFEQWLGREFEAPAEETLRKATAGAQLTEADWDRLIRFVAAQDVRTPARLTESLEFYRKNIPSLLNETLANAVRELEAAKKAGKTIERKKVPNSEYIPLRVTTEIVPGEKIGRAKAEVIAGRGLWLYSIKHLLTQTVNALFNYKWTILRAPDGLNWFTSDDPVVKLNYYADGKYDFGGGYGKPGTEIFLPLDASHLLYSQVGHRPPPRGSVISRAKAEMIRRFIAEHAHRYIFATSDEKEVANLRPRKVDAALLRNEYEQWRRWHEDQIRAERELMGWSS